MPSMEQRDRLGAFLRIRRGALQPQDVGLPRRSNRRLTPGLRREEVAELADISVSWYTRLEQGNDVFGAGAGFFGDFADLPKHERNLLWLIFTDEARRFFVNWERHARLLLAQFRDASRHFVGDPWIAGLVEQLIERSAEFAEWWSRHDVERAQETEKVIDHPGVGQLVLLQTVLQVVDDGPGMYLILYTPGPGTDTAARLQKLAIDSARA